MHQFRRTTSRRALPSLRCHAIRLIAVVALMLNGGLLLADGAPLQWGILIGVKDHDDDRLDLRYTDRDVKSLERVLVERAGISQSDGRLLELSDLSPEQLRPTKQNIEREAAALIGKIGADDRLVVFYSGHATVLDGELLLVPANFDRSQPTETGIPVQWLHDLLRSCRAKTKFLILDSCHAGGAQGVSDNVDAAQIAGSINVEDIGGCVVLASSRSSEESWEWSERRNGVFTYWLCRALEGGGDENGDGVVTSDEVYRYTHERVQATVKTFFDRVQTPVRLIGEDSDGDPELLVLRPEPPESVCRRLAASLDLEIRLRNLKRVMVLEFLTRAGGLAQANLPAYCAGEVRDALNELSSGAYEVLSEQATRSVATGIRIEELGDPAAMRRLPAPADSIDGLVIGDLRRRNRQLHVQCELVTTSDGQTVTGPTGVMPLSEDLLADNGASFDNRERPVGDVYDPAVVDFASDQSHLGHPLLQNGFPFEVAVQVVEASAQDDITPNSRRQKREFLKQESTDQSELLLSAGEGEVFEITIRSSYKDPVSVAMLVDGINVLGQQRERLGNARRWVQRPDETYRYEGWYVPKAAANGGQQAYERRRFVFTNLADSVAGRQGFTDSLGLITIGFFDANGRAPVTGQSLAVGEAQSNNQTLNTVDLRDGRLLGVIQIRYVDARLLTQDHQRSQSRPN